MKVKGRGIPRYRSRSRSRSPPYWRREEDRLIPMKKAKDLIARKQKEAEKSSEKEKEEMEKPKNQRRSSSTSSSDREASPVKERDVRRPRQATPDFDED